MASTGDSTQYTGRVKWFNKKAGYGFVTITDGDRAGDDVFVHHSGVRVTTEQFKYLVQGEYISFSLTQTDSEKHDVQAWEVRGVNGGMLMCETLNEIRESRQQHSDGQTENTRTTHGYERHSGRGGRQSGRGGRHGGRSSQRNFNDGPREGEEWLLVRRSNKSGQTTNTTHTEEYEH